MVPDEVGVLGRIADEMFPSGDVLPAQVDAGNVSWPSSVRDVEFSGFLDTLNEMFSAQPSAADASVDLD
jgi:hypothetical protein